MTRKLFIAALLVPAPLLAQAAPSITRATFEGRIASEFDEMDTNKDGNVTKVEADAWLTKASAAMASAQNKAIFTKLDADKNGSLSPAEFARAGPAPMKTDAGAIMSQVDANKDGKISKAENLAAGKARFTQLDTNKDNVLTTAEARAGSK